MEKLERIIHETRGSGNTTWILKSALHNPDCIIVCGNSDHARYMHSIYNDMINNSGFFRRLYWKYINRSRPLFVTPEYNFKGKGHLLMKPVIFDNGGLLNIIYSKKV